MAGNSRKARVLSFLLSGETVSSTASLAQVGERTIYRWLAEPEFRGELRSRQAEIIERVELALVSLAEQAVRALREVLAEPGEYGHNVKRLAAVNVLELVLHYRETLSFEHRLNALENAVRNEQKS